MEPKIVRCPGCHKDIDLAFETVLRDRTGFPWHSACMLRDRGKPRETEQTVFAHRMLWSTIVPLISLGYGIVAAIRSFGREEVGHGFAFLLAAVASTLFWLAIETSIPHVAWTILTFALIVVGLFADRFIIGYTRP